MTKRLQCELKSLKALHLCPVGELYVVVCCAHKRCAQQVLLHVSIDPACIMLVLGSDSFSSLRTECMHCVHARGTACSHSTWRQSHSQPLQGSLQEVEWVQLPLELPAQLLSCSDCSHMGLVSCKGMHMRLPALSAVLHHLIGCLQTSDKGLHMGQGEPSLCE